MTDELYKPGGPVFLIVGGEGAADTVWLSRNVPWMKYAEKLGALCFFVEHRFYGQSRPTADLSTSSLRYLSSRQALADLANFRNVMAKKMGLTNNMWVTFGGSYAGALAVWLRMKYPDLFAVAVGSSAPLLAKVDFYEYLEVIQNSLAAHNSECPEMVRQASDMVVEMLKSPENYDKLKRDFRVCETLQINSEMDSAYFLDCLASPFMEAVQFNRQDTSFGDLLGTRITIDDLCMIMTDVSLGSPYDRYAVATQLVADKHSMPCRDSSYRKYVEVLADPSWEGPAAEGARQWLYQTCTEFGFYPSSTSKNQPFSGFPVRFFLQQCSDILGPEFNAISVAQAVEATNEFYGGLNVTGSKIVFANGSIDPWHALGVIKDISEDLLAVYIEGEAHCANLYPAQNNDSVELTHAREKIFEFLQKWLTNTSN
nr:putative serine protease K12H4.7 isoform X2 [Microcebus murinus]